MAQNIRDFITECELYEYSQESFNLAKECSELILLDKYMTSQKFIAENADLIDNGDVTFTEGYFAEAAGRDRIRNIGRDAGARIAKVWEWIKKGFIKICRTVKNIFVKLYNKFDDLNKKAITVRQGLAKLAKGDALSSNDYVELYKIFERTPNGGYDHEKGWMTVYSARENTKCPANLKKFVELMSANKPANNRESLKGYHIGFALTDTYVGINRVGSDQGALSPDDLVYICERFIRKPKASEFDNISNQLKKLEGRASGDDGIRLNVNADSLQKLTTKLEEIIAKLEGEKEIPEGMNAEDIDAINKTYSALTAAVAPTLRVVTTYHAYRLDVVNKLSTWLTTKQASAKNSEDSAEE